ncbi:MAG: NYN domain-containing protein [Chloroflexi bacterium]|nr:NYN domain-containing protein [Chloroflexota bacterium]
MPLDGNSPIAVLIDGDNAQPSLLEHILEEIAKYGVVTTRRIYGDWTTSQMSGWKDYLHSYAFQPMQQFRYTTGKNATDSALIIDAMDILYGKAVGGFCIVSSDSDYTRLATRIREQGLFVMGIGRSTTPEAFVKSCEVFVYTENLSPQDNYENRVTLPVSDWTQTVSRAIEMSEQENGLALLAAVGSYLRQLDSSFDARSYGHRQLSLLVKSRADLFETQEPRNGAIRVRTK